MSEMYTMTGTQLAERLQTNPQSIRAYRAGQRSPAFLAGLPEPIQSQPRLLWLVADIEAWIESRRTFRPAEAAVAVAAPAVHAVRATRKAGPGRPTKAEEIARREGGEA